VTKRRLKPRRRRRASSTDLRHAFVWIAAAALGLVLASAAVSLEGSGNRTGAGVCVGLLVGLAAVTVYSLRQARRPSR
jgi:hypothetical protein